MLVSPFSAIYSWQGYEYQGHVALFVALQKIKDLVLSDPNEISDMILEIEGAEDFSIKSGNTYLSLNQVKRGAFSLDKLDKFSFVISLLQYNVEKGFFHVLPKKSIPTDFIVHTLDHIDTLLVDLNKEVRSKDEVDEDDYQNFIMLNSIVHNAKKGSLYNILYFICNGQKNKEEVIEAVSIIKSELIRYRNKLIVDNNTTLDDNELIVKYNPSFNNSREVKEASYEIISEILHIKRSEWDMFVNDQYVQFVYYKIFIELKNLIETDFINNPRNDQCSHFYFSKIYEIIIKDHKSQSNSIDYQYYLIRESIKDMYEKFPKRNYNHCTVDLCDECSVRHSCNLYKQIQTLLNIQKKDLHSFLYRIMLKEPDVKKPNNLPDDKIINRLLIKLLKEVDILVFEENNIIQAQKESKFYRLTLDSSGDVEELQEQLFEERLTGNIDKLLIYESDVLITDQLDKEKFIYDGNNTTVIGENEYKELKNITSDSIEKLKKNYSKPKIMRLITRSMAKEELNK